MATFKAQVQALTGLTINSSGTTPDEDELVVFMNDGIREVVHKISKVSPDKTILFTRTVELTSQDPTVAVDSGIIVDVVRESGTTGALEPANLIQSNLRYRATDIDSLFYRTKYNPAWYMEGQTLNVIPTPATNNRAFVTYVAYDTLVIGDSPSNIERFPEQYTHLIVLYAAHKTLLSNSAIKFNELPSDITTIELDSFSENLPIFVRPESFEMPELPEDVNINFLELGDIATFNVPSLFVDSPLFEVPDINLNFADADNWINSEEDSEMSGARVQVIGAQLQKHSSDIQIAAAKYTEQLDEYRNRLEKFKSETSVEQQRFSTSLSEYTEKVNKAIQTYQAETGYDLQKFQSLVQANIENYKQGMAQNMTDFETNLNKFQADVNSVNANNQTKLQKYTQDIQNFATKVQKTQTELDDLLQRATLLRSEYDSYFAMLAGETARQKQRQQQQQQQQPRGE
jgi:cytochrome c556